MLTSLHPSCFFAVASRAPNMMSLTVNVSNVMTTFAGSGTYPSYLNATYPGMHLSCTDLLLSSFLFFSVFS